MPWGNESTSCVKEQFKNEIPCSKMNTSVIITFRSVMLGEGGNVAKFYEFTSDRIILHFLLSDSFDNFLSNHNERKSG